MPTLYEYYPGCEIYLIRNELDYFIFSPKDGRRLSPDYLLVINDVRRHEIYHQIIIEPKGGHVMAKDEWKQQVLLDLNKLDQTPDESSIYSAGITVHEPAVKNWLASNGYGVIKPIGLPFYNHDDDKQLATFTQSFGQNLLS